MVISARNTVAGSVAEAECLRGKNLKRALTAIFAASAQQMIGATFVIGYETYFLKLIDVRDYFNASVVFYVMLLASMTAFPLTENVGRRTLLVGPQFALCFMLLLVGVMGCISNSAKTSWDIVTCIYAWVIIYQLPIGATGFLSLRLRLPQCASVVLLRDWSPFRMLYGGLSCSSLFFIWYANFFLTSPKFLRLLLTLFTGD